MEDSIRGPGFWKFNCSLLEDKEFVDGINEIIDKFMLDEGERDPNVVYDEVTDFRTQDPAMKWEILKMKITSFAQAYSKGKASDRRKKIKQLQSDLNKLEKKLAMINLDSASAVSMINNINRKIDPIKKELEEEVGYIAKGAIIRSKVNWYQYGEHNSRYFMALEKTRSKNKTMRATLCHDGTITENKAEILKIQAKFYEKLYTSNPNIKFEEVNEGDQHSQIRNE